MADFKNVTDTNGNIVFPITHINAVKDSNGNSLSSLIVPEKQGGGIGTCSTSSGTALAVSLSGYELIQNGIVAVTFQYDVPANATLNINSKGAKAIYYKGAAIVANTIKAGDTVMFAYNGTNYVVTSLGGSSSTSPELVIIQLTQSGGNDSDLIGATVVVTNDNTSAVILSTTWQGSNITCLVNAGINYTVTVGDVSNLGIKQHTQSYTSEYSLSRTIEFNYFRNAVDMGLPSGILWAKTNIDISQPNGFAISEFQYECSFFSYGNIVGHNPISSSAFDYSFNSTSYASTPGSALTGNVPVSQTYDIARAVCGDPWRLPTSTETKELIDNCNFVKADGLTVISGSNKMVTVNNIIGIYLKSKINGNHLFFPCSGVGNSDTVWRYYSSHGWYRTSTWLSNDRAYYLRFDGGSVSPQNQEMRCYGFSGRAVM